MLTSNPSPDERPALLSRALAALYDRATFGIERQIYRACRRPGADPRRGSGHRGEEAHRVLHPAGRLLVLDHVRARDSGLATWQGRLTPLWKTLNGGCHLHRETRTAVESAGFAFESLEEFRETRIPLPIVQPHLIGVARRVDGVVVA